MASYRKLKSGKWYAEIFLKGVRDSKGGFDTKAEARGWAEPREDEIRASNGNAKVQKTLLDALKQYQLEVSPGKKGHRWEEIRINKFIRELDFIGKIMDDVDTTDIADWKNSSLKRGLATSSVNREMNLLSNVFTVAKDEWKWCKSNPVREVKRPANPHHRDRLTAPWERQEMLDALGYVPGQPPKSIKQRVAYAYLIALETAMRESEICRVDESLMFLAQKRIHLPDTKNSKKRNVSLTPEAIEYWSFFPNGIGLTPSQIDANWRKARAKTKVKDLTFHDSCHQAITDLVRIRKLNVMDLSRTTGRSIKTLMIYYNEDATEIANKMEKLPGAEVVPA